MRLQRVNNGGICDFSPRKMYCHLTTNNQALWYVTTKHKNYLWYTKSSLSSTVECISLESQTNLQITIYILQSKVLWDGNGWYIEQAKLEKNCFKTDANQLGFELLWSQIQFLDTLQSLQRLFILIQTILTICFLKKQHTVTIKGIQTMYCDCKFISLSSLSPLTTFAN